MIRNTYSQSETISVLQKEGFNLTERMLRTWRADNDIPQLEREGLSYYYTRKDLDAIRVFAQRKDRAPEETLILHLVEGRTFDVVGIEIVRLGGRIQMLMHLRREGVLVRDLTEEEVDAIT